MAILEKEVEITLARNLKHFENLGYSIPKIKNKKGKMAIELGTKIKVKIEDLLKTSSVKVTKICDMCGKHIPNKQYGQIIIDREKNGGKDQCRSCSSKKANAVRLSNIEYEQSLEHYVKENNKFYLLNEYSNKNINKPNEIFKSSNLKYLWNCPVCKSEYPMTSGNRINGGNCPYCAGQKVNHTNCLWTTHPEVAKLLKNPQRGHELNAGSHCEEIFVCDKCNTESTKIIYNVVFQGFSCLCSDGISYPEKFMMSVLNQIDVDFKMQKVFNWSNKIKHENYKLNGKKRYDFYIPSSNMIIETHGMQHYEEGFKGTKTLKELQENDSLKEKLAKEHGIENYIVIDCRYSEFDFIKNNILNSKLSLIYDLSNLNWLKCHDHACSSLVKTTCDLWNKGIKNTLEIATMLNLGRNTVIKYLKQGSELKICDYNPTKNKGSLKEARKIIQLSLNNEFIKEFSSMAEASKELNVHKNSIWRCCKGEAKTGVGFKWMYEEDYNNLFKLNEIH